MSRPMILGLLVMAYTTAPIARAADPSGERVFKSHCSSCHALDENRWGPALRGVVGRPAGSHAGYDYSSGLRSVPFTWDEQRLDAWLQNPSTLVPGARMTVRFANAEDRRAVIVYLREQGSASH
jgi:cytochrome c